MKKTAIIKSIITFVLLCAILAGCGKKPGQDISGAAETSGAAEPSVAAETPDAEAKSEVQQPSLAKRLCGKYSYHISGNNQEDEYYILDVISF